MAEIRTRVLVGPDHSISGTAPAAVPPGEHEVTINVAPASTRPSLGEPLDAETLPTHPIGQEAGVTSSARPCSISSSR